MLPQIILHALRGFYNLQFLCVGEDTKYDGRKHRCKLGEERPPRWRHRLWKTHQFVPKFMRQFSVYLIIYAESQAHKPRQFSKTVAAKS
jgi:hypothetical protein